MTNTTQVFIASSREALPVAEAVNIKLEHEFRVKQWDNAFDLSSITLPALLERAAATDFAVFVFHADDKIMMRGSEFSAVRDNVLFELGLFIGAIGLQRCFVLVPRSLEGDFRLPTDLAGLTVASYDDTLEDMVDAVATGCAKIKQAIKKVSSADTDAAASASTATGPDELHAAQSELWMMRHDVQRALEDKAKLLSAIVPQFFTLAKPATETEIAAWEEGAKQSYPAKPKIRRSNVYFVDKPMVIPPLYGGHSISVIVASGVTVFGLDEWSHNAVYFMDGFRKID